jgi:hypothetical protein
MVVNYCGKKFYNIDPWWQKLAADLLQLECSMDFFEIEIASSQYLGRVTRLGGICQFGYFWKLSVIFCKEEVAKRN